jgi:hypothetical protein
MEKAGVYNYLQNVTIDQQEELEQMKQEKEETEKKITDCRSAAIPYAEEKRKLVEVVRDKEKNLQHIMVNLLVIYIYILISVKY